MFGLKKLICWLSVITLSGLLQADPRDDFPSCYAGLQIAGQDSGPKRELFVIIDQTLHPGVDIKRSLHKQVHSFLQPGDRITVVRFSAYIAENYTDIVLAGQLDRTLDETERYDISKKVLKRFDACMGKQKAFIRKTVDTKLVETFGNRDLDIPRTELVGSLSTLSQIVSASEAERKVVLLFSDMLENSELSSFYQSGALRKINPEHELTKYQREGLLGDWGGADIYVMGAGTLPAEYANSYRSENRMRPIKAFWESYFTQSNSTLTGWGQPALLQSIR